MIVAIITAAAIIVAVVVIVVAVIVSVVATIVAAIVGAVVIAGIVVMIHHHCRHYCHRNLCLVVFIVAIVSVIVVSASSVPPLLELSRTGAYEEYPYQESHGYRVRSRLHRVQSLLIVLRLIGILHIPVSYQ